MSANYDRRKTLSTLLPESSNYPGDSLDKRIRHDETEDDSNSKDYPFFP